MTRRIKDKKVVDDFGYGQEIVYRKIGKVVIDSKNNHEIVRLYGDIDDSSFIEIIENVDRINIRKTARLKIFNDFHLRGERYIFGRNLKVVKRHFLTRKTKNYYEVILK